MVAEKKMMKLYRSFLLVHLKQFISVKISFSSVCAHVNYFEDNIILPIINWNR
jgi:hypothetical protein